MDSRFHAHVDQAILCYTASVVDLEQGAPGELIQGEAPGPRELLERAPMEEITSEEVRRQEEADRRQADENGEGAPFIETGARTPAEEARREPTPGTDPRATERAQMEYETEPEQNMQRQAKEAFDAATPVQQHLDEIIHSITDRLGVEFYPGVQKSIKSILSRMQRNAARGRGSSAYTLKDLARTHIEMASWDQIPQVLSMLDEMKIPYTAAAKSTPQGYKGLHITWNDNGIGIELQLSTPEAWAVKMETEEIYAKWREMEAANSIPPELQKEHDADIQRSTDLWNHLSLPDFSAFATIADSSAESGLESSSQKSPRLTGLTGETQAPSENSSILPSPGNLSMRPSGLTNDTSITAPPSKLNVTQPGAFVNGKGTVSTPTGTELEQEYKRRHDAFYAASDANDTEFDYKGELDWMKEAEKQIGKERAVQIANGEIAPGQVEGPVTIDQAEQELLDVGEAKVETENGKYRLLVRRQSNGDYMAKVFKDGGEQVARRFATPAEAAQFASDYLKGQEQGYQDAAEEAERSPEQEPEVPTELPDGKEEEREYIRKKKNEAAKLSNQALRDRILRTQSQIDNMKRMDRMPGTKLTEQQRAHIEDLQETLDILVDEQNARKQRAKDRRGKAKEADKE